MFAINSTVSKPSPRRAPLDNSGTGMLVLLVVLGLLVTTTADALTQQEENRYRLLEPTASIFSLQAVDADTGHTDSPLAGRKPSVRSRISVMQVVAGTLGAALGGALGYTLAANSTDDRTVQGDAGFSPAGNRGLVAGSFVGSVIGVFATGGASKNDGTLLATAVGAALPTLIYLPNLDNAYMGYGSLYVSPLQGFLATIAFTIAEP